MEADREQRHEKIKEFVKSRIYDFLKENKQVEKVIFTSGEPTLNPDLINYIIRAKELGFKTISIISNGRRYSNKKFCSVLINSGANEFIISIHGHNKEIHDSLTRSPGSFEQAVKGLKNLSILKKSFLIRITISVVINKINYREIKNILKFLRQFNPDEIVFNVVQPLGGNMEKRFKILMPKYEEIAEVFEKVFKEDPQLFHQPGDFLRTKRFISITDLPICFLKKTIRFTGFGEERIIDLEHKTEVLHTSAHKEKNSFCRSCKFNSVCDGVYKNYIKNFGWEEFKPVISI
jgi:cyclic pyranopterin phosphate synthase